MVNVTFKQQQIVVFKNVKCKAKLSVEYCIASDDITLFVFGFLHEKLKRKVLNEDFIRANQFRYDFGNEVKRIKRNR